MKNVKINMTYDILTWRQPIISNIITKCIETTLGAENITVPCEINVLVTNDKGIHAINLASRQIDRPTDVLSFPMFQLTAGNPPSDWEDYRDPDSGLVPLGDMCISLERAMAQAEEFGHSFQREIAYLTAHSMLHLLGYDHVAGGIESVHMREKEEEVMKQLGLPRTSNYTLE